MKNTIFLILLFLLISAKSSKPAYQIFTGEKSKAIDFEKMIKGLNDADVVFFGESHNNSIGHWLELQVLKSLGEINGEKVVIGAEMFETDDQLILNEYLTDIIREEHLNNEAKLWDNYKTDYAPLVDYAKANHLPFIATNIPRRYASLVARNGLKALNELNEQAKKYICPLPIEVDYELPSYKEMADMMAGHMAHGNINAVNMVNSQAIKDATMAYFISQNLVKGSVFYHINGAFHTESKEGIIYYLEKSKPGLKIVTITTVDQDNIAELDEENQGLADYIIAIPSDMTKTY